MKVITKGTEKSYYQMCQHCRTELEYQFEDVKYTEAEKELDDSLDFGEMTEKEQFTALSAIAGLTPPKSPIVKELKCPVCNQTIIPLYYEDRSMGRLSEKARGGMFGG